MTEQSAITPDFLQRRFGPLSFLGWMGVLTGVGAVYYLYRRYQADRASAATTAATTTSQPVDTANTGTGTTSGTAPTATSYPDVGSWLAAVISGLESQGIDGATAYNAGLSWINGNCVSTQVYAALGQVIPTVGLPPGYGSASPVLSVCNDPPGTTPPPVPPSQSAITNQQIAEAKAIMTKLHGGQAVGSAAYVSEYNAILADLVAQNWHSGLPYPTGITQKLGEPSPTTTTGTTTTNSSTNNNKGQVTGVGTGKAPVQIRPTPVG